AVRDLFAQDLVPEQSLASAARGLARIAELFKQASGHFALMETMTTRDYLAFRDKLSPASGFQSAQLREIEILMGLRDEQRIGLGHGGSYLDALRGTGDKPSPAYARVKSRLEDTPSLRDAMDEWLYRTPIQGSSPSDDDDDDVVADFCEAYLAAHASEMNRAARFARHEGLSDEDIERLNARYERAGESARDFLHAKDAHEGERARRRRIRAAALFVESYRELPLLAWPREIMDSIVKLEQAAVVFRQRHARMVERVIGRRTGTGGSAGVDYLDQTALRYRVFDDVWAVRTLQLREAALPPVANAEFYGLVAERY
ncbi:MAG: tryptophan 2,3-dioxygenase family protein, partial [Myxococcota bacterium]